MIKVLLVCANFLVAVMVVGVIFLFTTILPENSLFEGSTQTVNRNV